MDPAYVLHRPPSGGEVGGVLLRRGEVFGDVIPVQEVVHLEAGQRAGFGDLVLGSTSLAVAFHDQQFPGRLERRDTPAWSRG